MIKCRSPRPLVFGVKSLLWFLVRSEYAISGALRVQYKGIGDVASNIFGARKHELGRRRGRNGVAPSRHGGPEGIAPIRPPYQLLDARQSLTVAHPAIPLAAN